MDALGQILAITLPAVFVIIYQGPEANAEDYSQQDQLVAISTAEIKSFSTDPNMQWFQDNASRAKAIFIVPEMLRGGFFIGGSGGSGVLLAKDTQTGKWSYPAFYTMGSISFGLQIGADSNEIILLVMSDKGLDAMLSTEFKLGADAAVAAGPVGASAKAQTTDILAFGRSKGAFIGLSLEGAVVSTRDAWNNEYYQKSVRPIDILIHHSAVNPKADPLRQALP